MKDPGKWSRLSLVGLVLNLFLICAGEVGVVVVLELELSEAEARRQVRKGVEGEDWKTMGGMQVCTMQEIQVT